MQTPQGLDDPVRSASPLPHVRARVRMHMRKRFTERPPGARGPKTSVRHLVFFAAFLGLMLIVEHLFRLPISASKKNVATIRTDALTLVEARLVGREEHIRWYNVVDLADASLRD
jgi:hypothetical protein